MWGVHWILGRFLSLVRYGVLRLMMRGAPSVRLRGLEIVNLLDSSHSAELFRKVDGALRLIETHDPQRAGRLRRDLKRIVFLETGPEYWPSADACVLHDVIPLSTLCVALLIIHEATHARLWQAGVRYNIMTRERVEKACAAAELAFLDRVPNSDEMRLSTEQKLEQAWWTGEALYHRHSDELEAIAAPMWIRRLYRRFYRPAAGTSTAPGVKR